jgi:hypothetical protein
VPDASAVLLMLLMLLLLLLMLLLLLLLLLQVFGALLVESPSLWIADEKVLLEDLPQHKGPWPARTFIATGGQGLSDGEAQDPDLDARMADYVPQVGGHGAAGGGKLVDERTWAGRGGWDDADLQCG